MTNQYVVQYIFYPREIQGTVVVEEGKLKFVPKRNAQEPYVSRFQTKVLDPFQGIKFTRGEHQVGPQDVSSSENNRRLYGLLLEGRLRRKSFEGIGIRCFADI